MKALKSYVRPNDKLPKLFFVTKYGKTWVKKTINENETEKIQTALYKDSIAQNFNRLSKNEGILPRGFYTLRHTFNTVAEGAADLNARKVIMGHTFDGMDEFYPQLHQRPEFMARLNVVTDHVRNPCRQQ